MPDLTGDDYAELADSYEAEPELGAYETAWLAVASSLSWQS